MTPNFFNTHLEAHAMSKWQTCLLWLIICCLFMDHFSICFVGQAVIWQISGYFVFAHLNLVGGTKAFPFLQIPHRRPAEYKRSRLSRNQRTVNRTYGGVLSGGAVRERSPLDTICLLNAQQCQMFCLYDHTCSCCSVHLTFA